jgi:hypothetical protein
MNWVLIVTILICFPFAAVFVGWLVLYIPFCNSAEKRWAAKVFDLLHKAEGVVLAERTQLRNVSTERDAKVRSLREKAYDAHLCDYSFQRLWNQ